MSKKASPQSCFFPYPSTLPIAANSTIAQRPDMLAALWSYITSLWLLIRNPTHAFYFKYSAPYLPVGAENRGDYTADGRLEIELTDFTRDVARQLEMSTLKGVGRIMYRTGRQDATSVDESNTNVGSKEPEPPEASRTGSDVQDGSSPNEEMHRTRQSPRRRPRTATRRNVASSSSLGQRFGDPLSQKELSSV
ncbi:hypothetical protein BKA70DRAFT_1442391 [Coprinopsis sp. MPI-PUGE-AT-0042]|nr:hypothetical protein BKA70DRAFT_1442391 [Coprinopsis sp. MPI-PUGE-AT-0042]